MTLTSKTKNLVKKILGQVEMIPYCKVKPVDNMILVTGASSKYFRNLNQLLLSYYQHNNKGVIVFDLGLSEQERSSLLQNYPDIDLRVFDYSEYPSHFNINIAAGEYAWKPVIIEKILLEVQGCICWMDAANFVTDNLVNIRRILARRGFYSPYSSGKIIDWTHPASLSILNVDETLLNKRNLAGGCVALNYIFPVVRELAKKWKNCALDKYCIAPEGSSRINHRQDQAALTILAYQLGLAQKTPRFYHGFDVQRKST